MNFPYQAQQRILFRVNFAATLKKQPDSAIDEQEPEAVNDPVKPANQTYSGKNESRAHNDGADDSPEQHAMLLIVRQTEVAEDEKKNKKIVCAERELDHIAGGEFERRSAALGDIKNRRKSRGQRDPYTAPDKRLAQAGRLRVAIDNAEVEYQHGGDEYIEENPGQGFAHE